MAALYAMRPLCVQGRGLMQFVAHTQRQRNGCGRTNQEQGKTNCAPCIFLQRIAQEQSSSNPEHDTGNGDERYLLHGDIHSFRNDAH